MQTPFDFDFKQLTDRELHDRNKANGADLKAARAEFIRLLPASHRRRIHSKFGFESIEQYAQQIGGLSGRVVREILAFERACRHKGCFNLLKAFVDGLVPWTKARDSIRYVTPEDEEVWIDRLKTLSSRALECLYRGLRDQCERAEPSWPGGAPGQGSSQADTTTQGPRSPHAFLGADVTAHAAEPFLTIRLRARAVRALRSRCAAIGKALKKPLSLSEATLLLCSAKIADIPQAAPYEEVVYRPAGAATPSSSADSTGSGFVHTPSGKIEVTAEELAARGPASDNLDLDEMHQQAKDANVRLMARQAQRDETATPHVGAQSDEESTRARQPGRTIPAEIQRYVDVRDGRTCVAPNCGRPATRRHHVNGFAVDRSHDPDFIRCLCREHHDLAHEGLIVNESAPPSEWRLSLHPSHESGRRSGRSHVDRKVQQYKQAAKGAAGSADRSSSRC